MFHIKIQLSTLPDARILPSYVHTNSLTSATCPLNVIDTLHASIFSPPKFSPISHIEITESSDPEAN